MEKVAICKFRCIKKSELEGDQRSYEFVPSYADSPENKEFFKYTPSGKLELVCVNPNVNFEPGKNYYLEIKLAE